MKKFCNYIIKMKRWKQVMLLLILWCIWGLVDVNNWQKAPLRDAANFKPYQDSAGMVARLSDENKIPFVESNKMRPSDYRLYIKAISNFPTVVDCLQKSEWDKPQPDLTKMDWNKIDADEEAAICLFRIASSYQKPVNMKQWFEVNGLKTGKGSDYTHHSLTGSWDMQANGDLYEVGMFLKYLPNLSEQSCSVFYKKNKIVYTAGCARTWE